MPRWISAPILLAVFAATPASAQLLGGGAGLGGLTGVIPGVLGNAAAPGVNGLAGGGVAQVVPPSLDLPIVGDLGVARPGPGELLVLRRERLRSLARTYRRELDVDTRGEPIRRDEVIGIDLSPAALAAAQALGFTVDRTSPAGALDIAITVLRPPRKTSAAKAIDLLKSVDGHFELNHVYSPAGGALAPAPGRAAGGEGVGGSVGGSAMGLVDGGIAGHPVFAKAHIEQRGFAGAVKPTGHGTAVASLIVGDDGGRFHGVATASMLYAADVYGGSPAAGSAEAIAQALGWLASRHVAVINISLVGPPNRLLEAAVAALQRRGILVVAAVGNDGPAAPPCYPASYAGVVAVTAVDARNRVLFEAGRASHLDFAAPGADMAVATTDARFAVVRGTSFASPLVAARLALAGAASPAARIEVTAAAAQPARDTGRGIVCGDCRTSPRSVGIRGVRD